MEVLVLEPNKGLIGKTFRGKGDASLICNYLQTLDEIHVQSLKDCLAAG